MKTNNGFNPGGPDITQMIAGAAAQALVTWLVLLGLMAFIATTGTFVVEVLKLLGFGGSL